MTRRTVLLALTLPALLPAAEEFAVITRKDNGHPITKAQVKKLLLGESANWPGGGKITLFLGPVGEASRAAALKQFVGMTETDYKRALLHFAFIGQADGLPSTLTSTAAVCLAVEHTNGSVGIVPVTELKESLKKLDIE